MSVYRDDASGLAARLADLRAAWAEAAVLVPADAHDTILARARRLWAGRVGVALVALMAVGLFVCSLIPPAPYAPHASGRCDSGFIVLAVLFFSLVLIVGFAVAKRVGGLYGTRRARQRVKRLLAGDTSQMDPARALAYLSEETPARVLAAESQRLERASIVLHLAASPWAAFLVGFMLVASSIGDATGVWPDWILLMTTIWLLHVAVIGVILWSLRQPARPWTRGRAALGILGIVAVLAGVVQMPFVGWLLAIHLVTLGVRGWGVRVDVLRERAALC